MARGAARLAYLFEGSVPPARFDLPGAPALPTRQFRNPIVVAQE